MRKLLATPQPSSTSSAAPRSNSRLLIGALALIATSTLLFILRSPSLSRLRSPPTTATATATRASSRYSGYPSVHPSHMTSVERAKVELASLEAWGRTHGAHIDPAVVRITAGRRTVTYGTGSSSKGRTGVTDSVDHTVSSSSSSSSSNTDRHASPRRRPPPVPSPASPGGSGGSGGSGSSGASGAADKDAAAANAADITAAAAAVVRGVVAVAPLRAEHTVLRNPEKLLLSAAMIRGLPSMAFMKTFHYSMSEEQLIALFLLIQRSQSFSFFAPYIAVLESAPLDMSFMWPLARQAGMRQAVEDHTNAANSNINSNSNSNNTAASARPHTLAHPLAHLSNTTRLITDEIQRSYYSLFPRLCYLFPHVFGGLRRHAFTLEKYQWAWAMILSRRWKVPVRGVETIFLAPLADMMNHRFDAGDEGKGTTATFNDDTGMLEVLTAGAVEAGEEVFYFYGDLCADDFTLFYGFSDTTMTRDCGDGDALTQEVAAERKNIQYHAMATVGPGTFEAVEPVEPVGGGGTPQHTAPAAPAAAAAAATSNDNNARPELLRTAELKLGSGVEVVWGANHRYYPAVISKVHRRVGAANTEKQATYDVRYPDTNEIEMAVVQSRIRLPKTTR